MSISNGNNVEYVSDKNNNVFSVVDKNVVEVDGKKYITIMDDFGNKGFMDSSGNIFFGKLMEEILKRVDEIYYYYGMKEEDSKGKNTNEASEAEDASEAVNSNIPGGSGGSASTGGK